MADCVTSAGLRSSAVPFKQAFADCVTRSGAASAASRVAWGGSDAPRSIVDWLPAPHAPVLDRLGHFTKPWYDFWREIASRLGGLQGLSLLDINALLKLTQSDLAGVTSYVEQVSAYTQSVAATTTALQQVAQNNDLGGASSVPDVVEPPRFDRYSQLEP